ncbi:gliding motility-associated C-terminal domain-containing protein [Hymenobacter sp. BT175]|uniref:DUF7948 domain-containing protein n=1 Tax=Hymenobacter translucens TaxID=2886507 RepID=UPI001D0E03EE|nr:gliding motility-associated C-terminal domain-containing protein [Hymenobacter translucens]MCC2545711.1 gliding motility-associated C-terminal domain-containing protein [Hymenobacter translucens]
MDLITLPAGKLAALLGIMVLSTQGYATVPAPGGRLSFIANQGQWPTAIRFKAAVPGGDVYLAQNGLVYDWHSTADLERAHAAYDKAKGGTLPDLALRGHAVFVDFVGARAGEPAGAESRPEYHNYFLGKDQSRWASRVPLYAQTRYEELYPGISLKLYGTPAGQLEYDFLVAPGAQASQIGLRYRGAEALTLRADGSLLVRTSVTDVHEQRPYAYQTVQGRRQTVPCRYKLTGNVIRYEFPQGYNHRLPLVIDPVVAAATYSGSTGTVFGNTAAYDAAGNIFTGGAAQTFGYPITPGAYQTTLRSTPEVCISKLTPNGAALLYATYLGGGGQDDVRAMLTNAAGDLFLLTNTGSFDFPTTSGCFDASANGGNDAAISRLSANGTALLGSTYLGGSGFDQPVDLDISGQGDVYVVGSTQSSNFPVSATAFSRTFQGSGDTFVARFNSTLSTLQWCTYLGGSGSDNPAGIKILGNGETVVAGNTTSSNFPVTPGVLTPTYRSPGEAFVTRLRADGTGLVASTYYGAATGAEFIGSMDTDPAGNVYLLGTTTTWGSIAATPGSVSAPSAQTFVTKLASDLRTLRYTATMGSFVQFSPRAMRVDACENIHGAGFSNSSGTQMPVLNPLPNGNSGPYYTFTLASNGARLLFGSYTGGSHDHTNVQRFDPQGRLYQAHCYTGGGFPTVSPAYSTVNRASGYDIAVFKIDQGLGASGAIVRAQVNDVAPACAPYRVTFGNQSVGTSRFRWNFGDGATDTTQNPSHVFTAAGTYRVRLVALSNGSSCGRSDTTYLTVNVKDKPVAALPRELQLCNGPQTLNAGNPGNTYLWSTGATTQSIVVATPGYYKVVISNGSCSTRDSTLVRLLLPPRIGADTTMCGATSLTLRAQTDNSSAILWSTGATTPTIQVMQSGEYSVRVTQGSCTITETRRVTFQPNVPAPNVMTPNGDGLNDTFRPLSIEPGTQLRVFNRWGRLVYSSNDYRNDWSGDGQSAGMYYFTLDNPRFCTPHTKGWVEIIK